MVEYVMGSVRSLGGREVNPKALRITRGPSRREWMRTQHAGYQESLRVAAVHLPASLGERTRRACRRQTPAYSPVEYAVASAQSLCGQEKSLVQHAKYQGSSPVAYPVSF